MKSFYAIAITLIVLIPVSLFSQGTWVQKANMPDTARLSAVAFTIGSKGYVGTGSFQNSGVAGFWEYDPQADSWTQKANFAGGIRRFAMGFAIGSKGYIGTGIDWDIMYTFYKDLWEYDPSLNSWTQKADFPGGPRSMLASFSVNGKGYCGTGQDANYVTHQDLWEFDPINNSWAQKANYPGGPRADLDRAVFVLKGKAYWGTGYDGNSTTPTFYSDFWEYNPLTDAWTQKSNFPGSPRYGACGFSICDYGFLGFGQFFSPANNYNDLWKFDVTLNQWSQVTSFPLIGRMDLPSFVINEHAYIGTGGDINGQVHNDLWEYTWGCEAGIADELSPNNKIQIYPNPGMGIIQLQSTTPLLFNLIRITDVSGRLVHELRNIRSSETIDLSFLPKGEYNLDFQCADTRYEKILIVRK